MLKSYQVEEKKRTDQGLPSLALTPEQTADLVELLKKNHQEQSKTLIDIFVNKIPAGVDPAAYIKAAFLNDVVIKKTTSPYISPKYATELLSTMLGGYNVQALVKLLESDQAEYAAQSLSKSVLIFDSFYDVEKLHKAGNKFATQVIQSWAAADWFTKKPKINPPVGPIKYIRPPPNAKTGNPMIPLKMYNPTVRVANFLPNNIAIINTAIGCKVIGTG